jgi:HK97 family phage portal protein
LGVITTALLNVYKTVKTFQAGIKAINSQFKVTYKLTDPTIMDIFNLDEQQKEKLTDAYSQLAMIYACITKKARALSSVPWYITKRGSDKPIESNDAVLDLFENPNPLMSKYDFIESLIINIDNGGEYFIYPDPQTDRNNIPVFMWVFTPDMIQVRTGTNDQFIGWTVTDGKLKLHLAPDELIQNKYYNPKNKLRGLKPLSPLNLITRLRFNSLLYSDKFFENDATPGVVFENENDMTPKQVKDFRLAMIEKRRGVKAAHEGLLLHGGIKAKTLSHSNKDIQLIEMFNLTDDDICSVFQTPKEIIKGNAANYATMKELKIGWWKETLIPLSMKIADNLNSKLLYQFDREIHFNFNAIDILNEEFLDKTESAERLYKMGVPFADINERLNMGFEHRPHYDEPFNSTPALPQPTNQEDDNKSIKQNIPIEEMQKAVRTATWKALQQKIDPLETRAARTVRKFFRETERKMQQLLKSHLSAETKDDNRVNLDDVLNSIDDEKLKSRMRKHIEEAIQIGVNSVDLGGVAFSMIDDKAAFFLQYRLNKITKINETIREELRAAIIEGVKNGETNQQIADRISHIMDKGQNRAKTIARTEVNGAYSDGRNEAMDETEPYGKMWISSKDDKVRDTHESNDGDVVKWQNTFTNGLTHPCDPNGPAEEVINCRCKLVAIYDPKEFSSLGGQG